MVIKKGLYIILRPVSRKIVLLCEKYTAFFVGSFKNIKLKKKNTETPLKVRHDLVYNNKVECNFILLLLFDYFLFYFKKSKNKV